MLTPQPSGVGIYVRKSSDKQGELSLPAQERICRQVIVEPAGLTVYRIYQDILSGKRPDRADYQQLLADARSGRLRMVVFHKVNRFGRDAAEGLTAVQELRKLGIEIRVADLPTLDLRTPEGMFIFTFLLGQGQYEVENLGSEARKGMQEKAERGGWPFLAPDGYRNCREEIAPRKFRAWVETNPYRAAIVRLIYWWYASGRVTITAIARRLNRLHEQRIAHAKPGCLRRSGKRWDAQAISRILTNRFYLGEIAVNGWGPVRRGTHAPIVRHEQFERVQHILVERGHGPIQRHVYPLQGLLWLDDAIPMRSTTVVRRGRPYTYYYHYNECERRVYYDTGPIDQAVLEYIRTVIAQLGADPAASIRLRAQAQSNHLHRIVAERRQEILQERQRILLLAQRGRFTEAEIAGALYRLDGEAADLERIAAEAGHVGNLCEAFLPGALVALQAIMQWESLDCQARQEAFYAIVRRVTINSSGTVVRFVWHPLWEIVANGLDGGNR